MSISLSAVILTKNEEKNITQCIESLDFCDEIIIIDDYSSDKTIEQVHKVRKVHKVYKVIQRTLNGDFAAQRNYGLKQASGEWVLFIDADERVSKELKEEILQLPRLTRFAQDDKNYSTYYIKRRDWWWGKELKHGEIKKVRDSGIIRLVKKDSGVFMGDVHEVFHTAKNVGTLNGYLDHYPHPFVKDFLNDINHYSTIRANELYNQGKSTNIIEISLFPLGKFILNYFIYAGFLDGPVGFAYAFFMSFHSFLVRAKLYQLKMSLRPRA